jgi:spermidine synthase
METIRLLADGAKGLQIGLGVGITASALTRQGVLVDVIELDPLVYRYASDWFNLRLNRTHSQVYLEDALLVLPRLAPSQYDFIIHDVFTGGLLESSLFSQEFLISIKRVMLPSAVLGMV